MIKEKDELTEALNVRIEALQIKNEALATKIEALELLNRNLNYLREVKEQLGIAPSAETAYAPSYTHAPVAAYNEPAAEEMEEEYTEEEEEEEVMAEPVRTGKKRGRKPKPKPSEIQKLQPHLDAALHEMLAGERFNRATYRALTGILLCLFENNAATVSMLHEYIGGARVTIVRHTALLKRLNLLRYEGSRKKGHYVLTEGGRDLYNRVRHNSGI